MIFTCAYYTLDSIICQEENINLSDLSPSTYASAQDASNRWVWYNPSTRARCAPQNPRPMGLVQSVNSRNRATVNFRVRVGCVFPGMCYTKPVGTRQLPHPCKMRRQNVQFSGCISGKNAQGFPRTQDLFRSVDVRRRMGETTLSPFPQSISRHATG